MSDQITDAHDRDFTEGHAAGLAAGGTWAATPTGHSRRWEVGYRTGVYEAKKRAAAARAHTETTP